MFLFTLCLMAACSGRKSTETEEITTDPVVVDTLEAQPQVVQSKPLEDYDDHGIKAATVDTMLMVIDRQGEVLGRWISTNASTYTVNIQDAVEIPKIGNKLVTFRARDGKGILFTRRTHVNIRQQPDLNSVVICQISNEGDGVPVTYPCLGKTNEWYKIKVNGKIGYVRHDLVEWDGMNTF